MASKSPPGGEGHLSFAKVSMIGRDGLDYTRDMLLTHYPDCRHARTFQPTIFFGLR